MKGDEITQCIEIGGMDPVVSYFWCPLGSSVLYANRYYDQILYGHTG